MRLRRLFLVASLALPWRLAVTQAPDSTHRASGATVSGVVRDSLGRAPLAGAWVQLVAADSPGRFARTVVSDSVGRYAIEGVPDGRYTLGFLHPLLDSLGVEPPLRGVRVSRGRPVRADLAIPSPARLRAAICGPRPGSASGGGAAVLGVVRDARERTAVAGVTVIGEWLEVTIRKGGIEPLRLRIVATTGKNGWFVLCNVPKGGAMVLGVVRGADSTRLIEVQVPETGFRRTDLYVGSERTVVAGDTLPLSLVLGPVPVLTDSMVRAQVDSAIHEFMLLWRYAWQESQRRERPPFVSYESMSADSQRVAEVRSLALHCHYFQTDSRIRKHIVTGTVVAHAACPMWYPPDGPPIDDERHGIDGGLSVGKRPGIQSLRRSLRSLLDSAAQRLSGDVSLAGQRVRLALDAGDLAGARAVAAACERDQARCGLLRGLVLYQAGEIAGADSAFLVAARMMRDDERCAWTDVGVLLDAEMRRAYAAMTCAARADLETRLWWLSDPLYLEPGNERRAEHFARKVLITLLAPLGDDGRQRWQPKKGGEAVAESLVRYGWPSQMYWGGPVADQGHDGWLIVYGADTAPPYAAREYTRDRLHTVPLPDALRSPFQAKPDSWQLNAPAGDDDWWPVEHYARDRGGIVQLPVGQTVMLRRWGTIRFAWAGDLDSAILGRPTGEEIRANVFQSRAVSEVERAGAFQGRIGRTLAINAPLRPGASLIGIEVPGDSTRAAARTRFGVESPKPLSALAGDRALSQPLLFEPPADARDALDADAAVSRMYGTTTFTRWRRIGVYWEAYGFAATDAVDIEVRMTREDRPGIFATIVGVLRLGREEGGSFGLRWREAPGGGGAIRRLEGDVPVQMRSVVLDISRLARGTYRLQLLVNKAGASAVTSERAFVLR